MPYIKQENRIVLEKLAKEVISELNLLNEKTPGYAGNLNFFISVILGSIFNQKKSYSTINELVGALDCAKLEFYRRMAAELEQIKIKENGDLHDYETAFRRPAISKENDIGRS